MGGEMKKKFIRFMITICLLFLLFGVYTLGVSTQLVVTNKNIILNYSNIQQDLDMLIFISPQYAGDIDITNSINSYISSLNEDLGWNVSILSLSQDKNNYNTIDKIIEKYYELYPIKACILVGEDTDTALGGHNNYMMKPSVVPWFTTGGEYSYEISERGIICQPYNVDICISLLYPTNSLDYQIKKSQIIYAFEKFSKQRNFSINNDILVFESSDINFNSKEIYQDLNNYGKIYYLEDPVEEEIKLSLAKSYSMYFTHGHSNPSGTDINAKDSGWFSANYLDEIDTPFFGADGCYVGGWWTNEPDSDDLSSSIDFLWYGSKIFTSENIVVMALGLLSQNGYSYPVSFIENTIPGLFEGKTLAESMIGKTCLGENIIIGDPTFHFVN